MNEHISTAVCRQRQTLWLPFLPLCSALFVVRLPVKVTFHTWEENREKNVPPHALAENMTQGKWWCQRMGEGHRLMTHPVSFCHCLTLTGPCCGPRSPRVCVLYCLFEDIYIQTTWTVKGPLLEQEAHGLTWSQQTWCTAVWST